MIRSTASTSHICRAQRIQNLAYALLEAGIKAGDRVAVIAPNWSAVISIHVICYVIALSQPFNRGYVSWLGCRRELGLEIAVSQMHTLGYWPHELSSRLLSDSIYGTEGCIHFID